MARRDTSLKSTGIIVSYFPLTLTTRREFRSLCLCLFLHTVPISVFILVYCLYIYRIQIICRYTQNQQSHLIQQYLNKLQDTTMKTGANFEKWFFPILSLLRSSSTVLPLFSYFITKAVSDITLEIFPNLRINTKMCLNNRIYYHFLYINSEICTLLKP